MTGSRLQLFATASACIVMGACGIAGDARAVTFSGTYAEFANFNSPGSSFSTTIAVDPAASSDGLFTLAAFGDFDAPFEWVHVSIEGLELGIFLDNNHTNDLFDNSATLDIGSQYASVHTSSAVILLANLASIVGDGSLTISYMLSVSVDDLNNGEFLTASITYDVAPVPVPATLPLVGTGIAAMGLMGWWRRRRSAAALP